MEFIVLQRQGQKNKELAEEPKYLINRPEEIVGSDPSFGEGRPVATTSSNPAPEVSKENPKGPQRKQMGPKRNQGQLKGKSNWHRCYPQGDRIPKLEPSARDNVFNMARTLIKFTTKEKERMNWYFSRK
ncbi:hypothetical protein O181_021310 [Austropuccinia psidii MF-1]|uniref:Uncharacterized protein n=1 Tax=Austropuccinia psidii MF-1 TaxID=1389203 RepID=A0A9Q3CEF5_9BASI|nr:hypothetical protein [Austropuccinia psidii MF-1]